MTATSAHESTALATLDAPRLIGGRDLILQADNLNAMVRVSEMMANSGQAVPRHLRKNPGACFAVTMQAMRWNMDPFALAQKTYTTDADAPLAYEGQAIIAALNNSPLLAGRLQFEWGGAWEKIVGRFVWRESTKKTDDNGKPKKYLAKAWDDNEEQGLWCTVTATLAGERQPRSLQLFLMQARVRNSPLWVEDPRQQLAYLAARRWGRLYAPDVIMGVYTPDELAEQPEKFMGMADVVAEGAAATGAAAAPPAPPPAGKPGYSAEKFAKNLPKWRGNIASGAKTAQDYIDWLETEYQLTDEQRAELLAPVKPAGTVSDVDPGPAGGAPVLTYAQVIDRINAAKDADELALAGDLIRQVADAQHRTELQARFDAREQELK